MKRIMKHAEYVSIVWETIGHIQDHERKEVEEQNVQWILIEFNNSLIAAIEDSLEYAGHIPTVVTEKCNILKDCHEGHVKVSKAEILEVKNILRRNPKYFCLSCSTELCKDCFSSACITHEVLWVGNRLFRCSSPYHVER